MNKEEPAWSPVKAIVVICSMFIALVVACWFQYYAYINHDYFRGSGFVVLWTAFVVCGYAGWIIYSDLKKGFVRGAVFAVCLFILSFVCLFISLTIFDWYYVIGRPAQFEA